MRNTVKFFAATAIALVFVSESANAGERWPRWYLGLNGGFAFQNDSEVSGAGTTAKELSFDNGYMVSGSIGYLIPAADSFFSNSRVELEVAQRKNDIDRFGFAGGTTTAGAGTYSVVSYMLNYYYDIPVSKNFMPYLGAGAGIGSFSLDDAPTLTSSDHSDEAWVYQAMAGIGFSFDQMPLVQFSLGYRYFGTFEDPQFQTATGKFDAEFDNHNVEAGVKFKF